MRHNIMSLVFNVQQFGFIFPMGWYEVCKIKFSHMGKNNGNPDLVCKKIVQ